MKIVFLISTILFFNLLPQLTWAGRICVEPQPECPSSPYKTCMTIEEVDDRTYKVTEMVENWYCDSKGYMKVSIDRAVVACKDEVRSEFGDPRRLDADEDSVVYSRKRGETRDGKKVRAVESLLCVAREGKNPAVNETMRLAETFKTGTSPDLGSIHHEVWKGNCYKYYVALLTRKENDKTQFFVFNGELKDSHFERPYSTWRSWASSRYWGDNVQSVPGKNYIHFTQEEYYYRISEIQENSERFLIVLGQSSSTIIDLEEEFKPSFRCKFEQVRSE